MNGPKIRFTNIQVTAEEGSEEGEQDQQLPAAWRIDRFLDNYEDEDFSSLAAHKLEFAKIKAKSDLMARNHDDDYMVCAQHSLIFLNSISFTFTSKLLSGPYQAVKCIACSYLPCLEAQACWDVSHQWYAWDCSEARFDQKSVGVCCMFLIATLVSMQVQDPLADKNQKWDRKEGAERRRNRAWAADMEGPMD